MNNYLITTILEDGSEVRSRVAADNEQHAITRLTQQDIYKNFIRQLKVVNTIVQLEGKTMPVNPKRYVVYTNQPKIGWHTVVDKLSGYIVEWQHGDFNDTHRITVMPETHDALKNATILREVGEYLADAHGDKI